MGKKGITVGNIIGIVIIILITIGVIFFIVKNNTKSDFTYYTAKLNKSHDNVLIEDYKSMKKLTKEAEISDTIQDGKKYINVNVKDYFNEDYFENKKLVVISLYEDNSKVYVHSVDDVTYNDDKTEVTINYTYDGSEYAESLNSVWYQYLFIEVEGTVTNVNYVRSTL